MKENTPLYRITLLQGAPDFSCVLSFDNGHPILKGHFPGNPVVPGAWLVQAVRDIAEMLAGRPLLMKEIAQVKFMQPVLPGQAPEVMVSGTFQEMEQGSWKVVADISRNDQVYARFKGFFLES